MFNVIYNTKYVVETISIQVSFSDVLPAGQTISGTPTISVLVYTGYDTKPSAILYQTPITVGAVVDQKFTQGVPGVIYEIVYEVQTTGGDTLEKSVYLAILPALGYTPPVYLPFWESTDLYPYYIIPEAIIPTALITGGNLQLGLITYPYWEAAIPAVTITSGTLTYYGTITYSMVPEGIIPATVITSGNMVYWGTVTYTYWEGIVPSATITGGNLQQGLVTYATGPEAIIPAVVITGGNFAAG